MIHNSKLLKLQHGLASNICRRPLPLSSSPLFRALSLASVSFHQSTAFSHQITGTMQITLTPKEAQLRHLLLDVAKCIDESKEIKERIELRFAGGWVRDKILGVPSHDIDTAINAMTGYAFGLELKKYLEIPGNLEKHGIQADEIGNIHVIAKNPEKSKHLETITTKMMGFDLDFVNLRKEVYSEESRNPQMEFGTAEEDALRRDATVNALFYNLHSDLVEDFTTGLSDMKTRIMKTPLEPYKTFIDDPLRVLRLIRFASRLGFIIDTEAESCMGNPAILDALRLKISRERVGTEVEKMLRDNNPHYALQLIDRLGLYSTIFTNPISKDQITPNTDDWARAYNCLHKMKLDEFMKKVFDILVRTDEEEYLAWFLVTLTPWSTLPLYSDDKPKGSKGALPRGTLAAREGVKATTRMCDLVTGTFEHYDAISDLKKAILNDEAWVYERDTVGMSIRRWDAKGGHWRLQVLFALLVESMHNGGGDYRSFVAGWERCLDHLERIDIMNAPDAKRPLDGTELAALLGTRPGKWMAAALDVTMAWQFRNPDETSPIGAVREVEGRWEELGIPPRSSIPKALDRSVSSKKAKISHQS